MQVVSWTESLGQNRPSASQADTEGSVLPGFLIKKDQLPSAGVP